MADTVFYSTQNHHNERELTIVNIAMLVGKAPTKEKRIRIKVRMLLSETINMGSPEFLDHAYSYVAQNHDVVSPKVEFRGYDLHFSADNLFEAEGVKSPRCQMRSFEVAECGDSENPDVATTFTIYMPFSAASWLDRRSFAPTAFSAASGARRSASICAPCLEMKSRACATWLRSASS